MEGIIISGIQQLGIGVTNVAEAWKWYRKYLGMDIKVFEESATASLMLPYTGGEPQKRHAVLALNMNGGGDQALCGGRESSGKMWTGAECRPRSKPGKPALFRPAYSQSA